MAKTVRIPCEVVCHKNKKHVFPVVFDFIPDPNSVSKVEVYCPECDARVQVTVKGKFEPNDETLRRFYGQGEDG